MSFKNGKKKWMIVLVVVAIAAIGIAAMRSGVGKTKEIPVQGTISYIEKRTIANSISGNGIVEAAAKEDITGGSYGMKVKSVQVEEGDMVEKGDIICVFDTTDIEERIADLQEQAIKAENNRATQNADYDKQMMDAQNDKIEQLNTAKTNLAEEEAKLAEEKEELAKWEQKYADGIANNTLSVSEELELVSTINSQKATVDMVQRNVDSYIDRIETLEKQDVISGIADVKTDYNERVTDSVEVQVDQIYELADQIEDATIRATMSGVVTAVNVKEGSNFNGGAVASIENLDGFIIEAQIEEYDIPDIAKGMKVLIKTDATRDTELEGEVVYVAPRATNSGSSSMGGFTSMLSGVDTSSFSGGSGSATYLVKIALNEPNERLRLGMNAKVSIITEESVDTWSVPYDAVYTREDGTTYLERVAGKDEDGNIITEEMNVEMGLQGTYYVEVISSEITKDTQILIPDAQGNSSIEELLNMIGADAGI